VLLNKAERRTSLEGGRPEIFLYPPWRGSGVVCDAFGLQRDKYEVHGEGRIGDDGAVIIDYTVAFGSGLTNVHAWRIKPDTGEQVVALDLNSGVEARGRVTAKGFYWATKAKMHTAFGLRQCQVELAYDILGPHECATSSTIAFLGVTVATARAHIRHLQAANAA
jgi:hypothetical protein